MLLLSLDILAKYPIRFFSTRAKNCGIDFIDCRAFPYKKGSLSQQ